MRRSFGGGTGGSGSGSGSGSRGMGGGSVQMLRSVQRAVRASASQEPFSSHSNTNSSPSKNSTSATASRRARQATTNAISASNKGNGLTLSSSSTSSPFYPNTNNQPISASSTAWPSSPTCTEESSDWVCVDDGLEDDGARVLYDDFVFGTVPSKDEVHHAILALKEVLDPGSPTYLAKDRSVNKLNFDVADQITSSTGSIQVASPFGPKLDWIEPPSQLWSSSMSQARGYDRVHDAFYLLRNEPSIQKMVMSLSSDRAVWDAVLNNEVVQELRESFNPDISPSEKSDDDGDHDASDVAKSFMNWIIVNTKAKVMEFIDKITEIVNELFHADEEGKKTDPFEEKIRTSFFLSIVVMLIVVVARSPRTRA